MNKFVYIQPFGNIYIDKIIFESYEPILFTCKDDNENLFLAVCCTSNNIIKKWLITSTTTSILISLLKDEITIRDAFLNNTKYKYSYIIKDNNSSVLKNNQYDWCKNSPFLPSEGQFLDTEEDEFLEEIAYFNSIQNKYIKYNSKTNIQNIKLSTTEKYTEFSTFDLSQTLNINKFVIGEVKIEKITINTKNTSKNLSYKNTEITSSKQSEIVNRSSKYNIKLKSLIA